MAGKLNRHAFENLVAEDLDWLLGQPRCLEREHIAGILRECVGHYYPLQPAAKCTGIAAGWCPNCGTCTCPHYPDGERIADDHPLDISPEDLARMRRCPLHGPESTHDEEID
jgi:hypothetical protein